MEIFVAKLGLQFEKEALKLQREPDPSAILGVRTAYFGESGWQETQIFNGDKLLAGDLLPGPTIIERMGDTILIPPGFSGRVDRFGNIIIKGDV